VAVASAGPHALKHHFRYITMAAPNYLDCYMHVLFLMPNQQCQSIEAEDRIYL